MANIKIPKRYESGLFILRKLNDNDIEIMLQTLNNIKNIFKISEIEDKIRSSINISSEEVKSIITMVLSLHATIIDSDISIDIFTNDICDAMQKSDVFILQLSDEERIIFKHRLENLLNIDIFKILSKAVDLQSENEQLFCNARIITDIRPIFETDIEKGLKGTVIFHTLKIVYHGANNKEDHQEFYVALDSDDLSKLRSAIDRAEEKHKVLESSLKTAGIPYYCI